MSDSKSWHHLTAEETLVRLHTRKAGVSETEAKAALAKHGPNALPHESADGWVVLIRRQLVSPLMIILMLAAIVSAGLGDVVDTIVILAAVVLNTVVGFVQEYRATRALERLRSYVPVRARVRRDGRERTISADELVPGDVVLLASGDRIAADMRLMEASSLEMNEAALTGESMPAEKSAKVCSIDAALADRTCMVYAGTSVAAGRGVGVVVATGAHTELGTIAGLVRETREEATPLQTQLGRLARVLSGTIIVLVILLFGAGVARGLPWEEMLETSVALAVAAIPEGMAVTVTVILAIGMQRILKRGSLARNLLAAETLGSVSVICADKTGTITLGEMRVSEFALAGKRVRAEEAKRSRAAMHLLEIAVLCNDASAGSGTPTDRALLEAGNAEGISRDVLLARHPRTGDIPFESSKRYMVTRHHAGSKSVIYAKGAVEQILTFCDLDAAERVAVEKTVGEMAEQGLRVLAFAEGTTNGSAPLSDPPSSLAFVGCIGLRDPLRAEAKEQIRAAAAAGIRTVMLTGDHPETARAIAEEAGLASRTTEIVTGAHLDAMSDRVFAKRVADIQVYARVEPRHKIRIVRAWQLHGDVVAMTGDGVNDAPALKAADIGVALGSGTDVAKDVSDLVLLDNNLGTITAAVEQGRVLFDNIRKTVTYLLTDSFTEIVLIAGALLFGLPLPLFPLQILWINLVADTFPNIALTLEPGEPDIMRLPPRRRKESILTRDMITLIFIIGLITDAVLFAVYAWLLQTGVQLDTARSLIFAAAGVDSLLYVFAIRSLRRSVFMTDPRTNPWLLLGVAIGGACLAATFLIAPLRDVFGTVPLSLSDWGLLLMMGALKLVAIELAKFAFLRRRV